MATTGLKLGCFESPSIDLEGFSITDPKAGVLHLNNLHHVFLSLGRRERLAYVKRALNLPKKPAAGSWDEARASLRPVVRHGGLLRMADLQARKLLGSNAGKPAIASRPLVGSLHATVAVDTEHHIHAVSDAALQAWGKSLDEVLDVAIANLRRISDEPFEKVANGLWMAPWRDSYAAARLVCPEILQRVCTDPWCIVPSRDLMLVADRSRADGLEALVNLLRKEEGAYPLSCEIYGLQGKRFDVAVLPTDHPARPVHRRLMIEEAAEFYDAEREAIEANPDDDIFYASYGIHTDDDSGQFFSMSVWTDTVDTLLPQTELVYAQRIAPSGTEVARHWWIPWKACVDEPGLLERSDSVLPRWRTRTFPTDAWLDRHAESEPAP